HGLHCARADPCSRLTGGYAIGRAIVFRRGFSFSWSGGTRCLVGGGRGSGHLFPGDLGDRGNAVAFAQVHDADALCVTADHADLATVGAVDQAVGCDEHDVFVVVPRDDTHNHPVALAGANVPAAFPPPPLLAVAHGRAVPGRLVPFTHLVAGLGNGLFHGL